MVLITATCTVLQTSTRVLKALCLSDLIPWRGRDSANAAGVWGERSQWLDHTGVATIQCAHAPSRARLLGMLQEHSPRWAVLLRGAGLRLWHSWQIWAFQDLRKIWVVTGCLFTAWWLMLSLGPKLQWSLTFYLWLSCTCLSASGAINGNWLIPPSVFSRTRSFVLWAHQGSECCVRTFLREWSSVSLCFSGSPIVFLSVLCHISPLRVASGFSLRTDDAAHTSTLSPHWLRAYTSMWATSQLEIAILFDFCGQFSWLCFHLRFLSSLLTPPVRGFPTIWKLLLHDSLPRMVPGPCPEILCLPFHLYLLPCLILRRLVCLSGHLGSSASVQKSFCESCSTYRWSFWKVVVESREYTRILGPRRRQIQSGARDEAWLLRAFV